MKLIIFFNGWGMNNDIFSHFSEEKEFTKVFINFPYSTESIKKINTSLYEDIYIIAWSFGVYYANLFLEKNPQFQKYFTLAINGTPEFIGKYGIPEKVFTITTNTLSLESLAKFDSKMLAPLNIRSVTPNIKKLQEELVFFKNNYKLIKNYFKYVLLSKKDKIVPFKNQTLYYEQEKVKIKIIDNGHYIFNYFSNFTDIISSFCYEI